MKKNVLTGSVLALSNALMTTSAHAFEVKEFILPTTDPNQPDLLTWVNRILGIAVGLTSLVAVAVLIFAGYTYITANGDEAKVKKANQAIIYAIVGMVVAFAANMIIRFVINNILNVK
ncbi:hypothetical protein J6Z48_00360 [bacterium]|nr:hypothetical protein [bacterium]